MVKLREIEPATPGSVAVLKGARFAIVDDGRGVALQLATLLEEREARAQLVQPGAELGADGASSIDGFIDLSSLGAGSSTNASLAFPAFRQAALAGARWLVAVTANGGTLGRRTAAASSDEGRQDPNGRDSEILSSGAGMPGMMRTIAHEFPDSHVRAVDLDPKEEPSSLAATLLAELLDTGGRVVVGAKGSLRVTTVAVAEEIPAVDPVTFGLDSSSVVLLTG